MVLKEKVRLIWGSIFILMAFGIAVYFIYLTIKWRTSEATTFLSLLAAVLAIVISLFNNVKLRNKWKK